MNYRQAAPSDCELLATLNLQLIEDEGHLRSLSQAELTARMCGWLRRGEYQAIIFEKEDPVVYALYKIEPEQIFLRQFYVVRDQRRKGLGLRAIQVLRKEIWPQNKRLYLEVLCGNETALAFYRAAGFEGYLVGLELRPEV